MFKKYKCLCTEGKFAEVSDPTVGVDFFARLVQVRSKLQLKRYELVREVTISILPFSLILALFPSIKIFQNFDLFNT